MYRQFGYVNRKKITLNRSKRLLYNKSFNRTANIPVISLLLFKATFFWQRRKWPIFLSDIDKFKVSTSKETCVGTCHFINNMSPTIFFLKTSKNNALWFSFQPSNYIYCEITHRFFFFEKKRTQFSNIFKFKTYYY